MKEGKMRLKTSPRSRPKFALIVVLVLLISAVAQGDPDQLAREARQQCLANLPGTYDVEGYNGVQHFPRMKPSYQGTLTITPDGDRFRVRMQWPQGSAEGIGMLTLGRVSDGFVSFQLVLSTRSNEGKLAVTYYSVSPVYPSTGNQGMELSGPWMGEKDMGYEQARKR